MRDISLSYEDGSIITGVDAIKQQYEIALFTVPIEFSANPTFGIGIEKWLGEPNNPTTAKAIRQQIISRTRSLFPEIKIERIMISQPLDNQVSIQIDIIVIPYSAKTSISKDIDL